MLFGSARATVTTASATSFQVAIPTGAAYKPITVSVAGNVAQASSPLPFSTTFTGGGAIPAGSFSANPLVLPYGSFATKGIAAGDIDGDGKIDLLSAISASVNFSLFRNASTAGSMSFPAAANTTWLGIQIN